MIFRNQNFKLALISIIATFSILAAMPKVRVFISNPIIRLDSSLGGYVLNLFGGKLVLDLSELKKGLDLQGGIRVVMGADMSKIQDSEKDAALESAKEVISRRVNLLGVTEAYVATSKVGEEYRIIVEIPGVENVTDAVKLIGQTAQLSYKVLKPGIEWKEENFQELLFDVESWEETGLTGADMIGADVVTGQQGDIQTQGKPQIRLRFNSEGRKRFEEIAKNNINKPIGLFLDDEYPLSAPIVDPDLAKGLIDDPVISGNFTFESAKNLSIQIRAGALPVPVRVLEQETIGATLGDDSVQRSFFAAFIGIILVIVFLIFRYGKLGILASISLIIYSAVVLTIYKIVPVVLTLPGIAGFILSIGMATDANVLIFERIREELYWGKPKDIAFHLGFDRAWNSIRDSNISSIITSFILFQLGSGPVKGFALTLGIGIVVSLFTSIFVVRNFIEVLNFHKDKVAE
ncbi:MAG TPA: protein translocase subunit SecD [bacterium]|nr:protein translocase subunit SecD [bacterium]